MLRWTLNFLVGVVILGVVLPSLRSQTKADPKDLSAMIDRADKLVVLKEPGRKKSPVLFESTDRKDLDALKAALKVRIPRQYIHCMCDGTPGITLYAKNEVIGWISNQHGQNIRFSEWDSDAELLDPEPFLKWFDNRKIPGPRKEVDETKKREKEWAEFARKSVNAMPISLKPHWQEMESSFDFKIKPLEAALAVQIPDKNARILALFSWFGSGSGPWSGFPAYENVPEKMLLEYPTTDLLAAIKRDPLTESQIEGAARFFGGWYFSRKRPDDRKLLPADLKARLLKHSLTSKDEDKRGRATSAFGDD